MLAQHARRLQRAVFAVGFRHYRRVALGPVEEIHHPLWPPHDEGQARSPQGLDGGMDHHRVPHEAGHTDPMSMKGDGQVSGPGREWVVV